MVFEKTSKLPASSKNLKISQPSSDLRYYKYNANTCAKRKFYYVDNAQSFFSCVWAFSFLSGLFGVKVFELEAV